MLFESGTGDISLITKKWAVNMIAWLIAIAIGDSCLIGVPNGYFTATESDLEGEEGEEEEELLSDSEEENGENNEEDEELMDQ